MDHLPLIIHSLLTPSLPKLSFNMIPRVTGSEWTLLYSTFKHGISLQTLYRRVESCHNSPCLLVIRDEYNKVCSIIHLYSVHVYTCVCTWVSGLHEYKLLPWLQVFGAMLSCTMAVCSQFVGTGESYLYSVEESGELKVYSWTGINNHIFKGDVDCISVGGGE